MTTYGLGEKIAGKTAVIGVIGLGYVGLPLIRAFVKAGFKTMGFDVDQSKVDKLKAGQSYIKHIDSAAIAKLIQEKQFEPTSDMGRLGEADCIIICVPTPLNESRDPDLSYIEGTAHSIAKTLRKGQLVVLESTTHPTTTRENVLPVLNATGLTAGKDYFLAFSPEREDPGNPNFEASSIPKILENTYRAVNIAMVNELKMLYDKMGIDVWEVIDAAKTKPFGFQAFYPGPGLGGHCIPIDPFYLTWLARKWGEQTRFIELAGEINTYMPTYVVTQLAEFLNDVGKPIKGSKIAILGAAYKKDVDDPRESPSFELMKLLSKRGAVLSYNDPHIPTLPKMRHYPDLPAMTSQALTPEYLAAQDCVLISTDHSAYDHDFIVKHSRMVLDTRNATKNVKVGREKIFKA